MEKAVVQIVRKFVGCRQADPSYQDIVLKINKMMFMQVWLPTCLECDDFRWRQFLPDSSIESKRFPPELCLNKFKIMSFMMNLGWDFTANL
jgi:hypothetical protein